MLDSTTVFDPGFRVTDANGDPVSGAKLKFYNSGTSTPKTVYADSALTVSLGSTVTCDSGGYPTSDGSTKVLIWTGTASYKIVVTDASDATIATHDGITGAISSASLGGGMTEWETPVSSLATDTVLTTTSYGKLIQADPTGGAFTVTIPSAVTAGDGARIGVRHNGTANQVKIATQGGQTIKLPGNATSSGYALTGRGHSVWVVSDGANWSLDLETRPIGTRLITITSRETAAPASPTPGARYIVDGTPTGTWLALGFTTQDIAEADGQGSWIRYSPTTNCGWLAYSVSDSAFYAFKASAWVVQSGMSAPSSSAIKVAVFEDQKANGTAGGTATSGSKFVRTLNTSVSNTLTSASLASNQITLGAATYLAVCEATFSSTNETQLFFESTDGTTVLLAGNSCVVSSVGQDNQNITLVGTFTLASSKVLELKGQVQTTAATTGLGVATGFSAGVEKYARVTLIELTALQGPQGATGATGSTGTAGVDGADAGLSFTYNSSTSAADPGTGKVAFNSGTFASITSVYISETDASANGLASEIQSWDDPTSTIKTRLRFQKGGDPTKVLVLDVSGSITDNGTWGTIPVTYVRHTGSFTNLDGLKLSPAIKGDKGDAGATGSTGSTGSTGATGATGPNTGLDYQWNTATSGDPGTGKLLVNNATPASATQLNISESNQQSASQSAYIATWDDGTTASNKGIVRIVDVSAPGTNFLEYRITGALTDVGAYDTFPVTYVGGAGTIANAAIVAVMFFATGDKGTDGAGSGDVVGPAASVDSELALFSSTTGKLLKRATLTGLVKAASGVASAATAGTDYVVPGGALGTPSSGTLTNTTGLPISTGVSGLGTGVATALAVNVGSAGAFVTFNGAVGTPSSITLTNGTGLPISGITGLGTGVGTALAIAVGSAGAFVTFNGAGGTPSSITLTNGTSLPVSGITASTSTALGVGSVELGHATDTTLSRSAAGELAVEGTLVKKVGTETIYVPAAAMTARTTNGAAAGTAETTTNKIMLSTLDFDTTTQEFAQFAVRMPKSWNLGTVTATFTWSHAATATNFGVVWALEAVAISDQDAGDAAVGTAQQIADTGGTTNTLYVTSATSAITIAGTPAAQDWVVFQVKRVPADASDTMAIDARLHGVTVNFTTNASTDA